MGDVTSLLAVLNRDWTDVNIHIVDGMWFVWLKPIRTLLCTNRRHKKIVPIATMAVCYTTDIPAHEYTAIWTAQSSAATRQAPWIWHLSSQYFLNEQYIVFTYTTYSLIQTQRDCVHTVGLKRWKCIFECKLFYI